MDKNHLPGAVACIGLLLALSFGQGCTKAVDAPHAPISLSKSPTPLALPPDSTPKANTATAPDANQLAESKLAQPFIDRLGRKLKSSPRDPNAITEIVLHDTDEVTPQSTFDKLYGRGLAYHYVIDTNGTVFRMVNPKDLASHTGGDNTPSIGIAFVAGDDNEYQGRLAAKESGLIAGHLHLASATQIASAIVLIAALKQMLPSLKYLEGHHDVETRLSRGHVPGHAPDRKTDPLHVDVFKIAKKTGLVWLH